MKLPTSFRLEDVEIFLSQDGGYLSDRPVPELRIKGTGEVELSIKRKPFDSHTYQYTISQDAVLQILEKAMNEEFFDHRKSYKLYYLRPNDHGQINVLDDMVTDANSSEISIRIGEKTHRVWAYFKSSASFQVLEKEILERAEVGKYLPKS
jgi:hypothetical protein